MFGDFIFFFFLLSSLLVPGLERALQRIVPVPDTSEHRALFSVLPTDIGCPTNWVFFASESVNASTCQRRGSQEHAARDRILFAPVRACTHFFASFAFDYPARFTVVAETSELGNFLKSRHFFLGHCFPWLTYCFYLVFFFFFFSDDFEKKEGLGFRL